jgi:phosphate-selective porin OprO/OprP
MIYSKLSTITAGSAVLLTLLGTAQAGTSAAGKAPQQAAEVKEESPFDKIWSLFTLYKSDTNPVLQKLAISGRYQGQYGMLDSDQGNYDDWENRRFRLGLTGQVFKDFEFKAEMFGDLNEGGDFYSGLTEVFLAWKADDAFKLTIGKQKPRFSLDWDTSSREILTFERNIMINNFGLDYETGISASGKSGNFAYFVGAFNNDVGDTGDKSEFGDLSGGFSYVASASYDLKDSLGLDKAVLRADFIHSEHDGNDELLTRFDNGLAASFAIKQGSFGLTTEAVYGEGDKGDIWGVYITPTYDITKKLQLVARLTYAGSPDDALRLQSRYERKADKLSDSGNGESYQAGYLGFNYFIYGHKLKLMTGVEFSHMDGGGDGGDIDAVTALAGIRISW